MQDVAVASSSVVVTGPAFNNIAHTTLKGAGSMHGAIFTIPSWFASFAILL